jgi:hypothetical protein
MIFWLVSKLEISSNRVMISRRLLVSLEEFFEDYIFAWWNIWISIILLLLYIIFRNVEIFLDFFFFWVFLKGKKTQESDWIFFWGYISFVKMKSSKLINWLLDKRKIVENKMIVFNWSIIMIHLQLIAWKLGPNENYTYLHYSEAEHIHSNLSLIPIFWCSFPIKSFREIK